MPSHYLFIICLLSVCDHAVLLYIILVVRCMSYVVLVIRCTLYVVRCTVVWSHCCTVALTIYYSSWLLSDDILVIDCISIS